jgi:hypothetical protein
MHPSPLAPDETLHEGAESSTSRLASPTVAVGPFTAPPQAVAYAAKNTEPSELRSSLPVSSERTMRSVAPRRNARKGEPKTRDSRAPGSAPGWH